MKADTVGGITPAILVTLRPGEKILSEHGIMLYMEPTVKLQRRTQKSLGVSRTHLMGMHAMGDSEESHFFAEFEGPGHVTFSRDKGGEVRIEQLQPSQTLRVTAGHMVCFDPSVRYYPMTLARWVTFNGSDQEVHYLFGDEMTGPGTIVFQSYGNVLTFRLKPGEAMRTSIASLLAVENTVGVNINWLSTGGYGGGGNPSLGGLLLGGGGLGNMIMSGSGAGMNQGTPILDLVGPGTVMVHSGV